MPLVLAVEDDPTQRLVLEWELERLANEWGFRHAVVEDLASARRMARSVDEVFLLCDENLPDGQGAAFLREQAAHGHRGIVMTAGGALRDDDIEVHAKPSSLDEQRTWLRHVLSEAGLRSSPGRST